MRPAGVDDGDNVLVCFDRVVCRREKATLLEVGGEEVWVPNSQLAHIDEDTGEVWLPLWLAEKKGLDYL